MSLQLGCRNFHNHGVKQMSPVQRVLLATILLTSFWNISYASSSAETPARFHEDSRPSRERSPISQSQVERLRRVMLPLVKATDHPGHLQQIRVRVIDDPKINAASAGNGEFYVTTGLLNRANDDELRGVLAHEIAHDDLGHPAKVQVLGTGLGLGAMLLEQFIPGSRSFAPMPSAKESDPNPSSLLCWAPIVTLPLLVISPITLPFCWRSSVVSAASS